MLADTYIANGRMVAEDIVFLGVSEDPLTASLPRPGRVHWPDAVILPVCQLKFSTRFMLVQC